ncbi:MAG: biotin/lipoyl-containing protein [Chloroflexota bacterium]|nr:biotin/lipoyl-containing protein [Chloroflexota bacterium]
MPIYHITVGEREYTVEIANPNARPVQAIVDGETIAVQIENLAQRETAMPLSSTAAPALAPVAPPTRVVPLAGSGDVTAPLPGVLVAISVQVGDTVTVGQDLCVLEAMKMKNPIRATHTGKVTAIHVTVGQQVPYGAPLLTLES